VKGEQRHLTRLAELRQVRGLTQREVAERAGVTRRTVGEVERGEGITRRTLGTYLRLARALRVPAVALIPALGLELHRD